MVMIRFTVLKGIEKVRLFMAVRFACTFGTWSRRSRFVTSNHYDSMDV